MVVLRKRLGIDKGSVRVREEYRYFFFITNDRAAAADELVLEANGRCDQENVIAQLKGGVHALKAPVNDLVSNWAYMVMASLAWTLKAWAALLLPEEPRHAEEHRAERRSWLRMEFATFRAAVIELPCQVVRGGRAVDLPAAVVESVARGVAAAGGAAAGVLVVLTRGGDEVGVRMPRSVWAAERREGVGDGGEESRRGDRGPRPPGSRRCVLRPSIASCELYIARTSYHACFGSRNDRRLRCRW